MLSIINLHPHCRPYSRFDTMKERDHMAIDYPFHPSLQNTLVIQGTSQNLQQFRTYFFIFSRLSTPLLSITQVTKGHFCIYPLYFLHTS